MQKYYVPKAKRDASIDTLILSSRNDFAEDKWIFSI
jgi:hypothetical protein